VAQWYRERFGRHRLAEVVRDTYRAEALPTLAHYLLMSLPVRHVITTNYDELLERALTALKRYPVKVARQEDVPLTGQSGVHVIKLHGDVDRPDEIVLTRDDYDEFFERRPAMALLLEGLLLNQTFFFVGYGLRDPNFRQVYSRLARMLRESRQPAFATTFEAGGDTGALLAEQWRHKHLQLIPIRGDLLDEQAQQLLRFLDGLAERVALQEPRLFLAPEVEVSEELASLRKALVEQVGPAMEALARTDLSGIASGPELNYLAQVLDFLAQQGWRPVPGHGLDLCRLWEHLAGHTADPAECRRLLIEALATAEAFADVQRLRGRLAEEKRTGDSGA
jgi:hypothetical protein